MMLHHWKKHAFSAARMLAQLHRYINTHRVLIQHPNTNACSKNSSETDSSTPLYQQCFEIGLYFQTICCIAIVFNNTTIQLYTNSGGNFPICVDVGRHASHPYFPQIALLYFGLIFHLYAT